jgi:hypothetical protein
MNLLEYFVMVFRNDKEPAPKPCILLCREKDVGCGKGVVFGGDGRLKKKSDALR